jgi:hypothetical protein
VRLGRVILASGLCVSSAIAGTTPGTEPAWKDAPHAESRRIASDYAKCTVETRRRQALATLEAPFGGPGTAEHFAQLVSWTCLNYLRQRVKLDPESKLHLPPLVTRGLLYQALYERDFGKSAAVPAFVNAATIDYRADGDNAPESLGRNYRALMRIGDCTVRAAPAQARALVLSKIATADEESAMAALASAWQACMPRGASLQFSPEMMRGTVAEPLYRLTERNLHVAEAAK